MKKLLLLVLFPTILIKAEIIDLQPFHPQSYESCPQDIKNKIRKPEYEKLVTRLQKSKLDWQEMRYQSGEHTVSGFIVKQAGLDQTKKHPAIIFNRNGFGTIGTLSVLEYELFSYFAKKGYIIFASQYRSASNHATDDLGGKQIEDILEITKLAQGNSLVDQSALFMLGLGRGGLMTYRALAGNTAICAAATFGGISDLALHIAESSDGTFLKNQLVQNMPELADEGSQLLACVQRSAVCFADEIKTPLLLVHGKNDGTVRLNQTFLLAESLKQCDCPHEVALLRGDSSISHEKMERVHAFFKKYRR